MKKAAGNVIKCFLNWCPKIPSGLHGYTIISGQSYHPYQYQSLYIIVALLQAISTSRSILIEENGKDLPTNYNFGDLSRRRRPSSGAASSGCNFNGIKGGKYKTDGTGRTFFDLQLINVGYNDNYNINCGGGGAGYPAGGGINKPILGDHKPIIHRPTHKPILGGHHQQGAQGDGGHHGGEFLANRPLLSMLLANRPLQGLFVSQSQSQSQSDSQTGVFSEAVSGIVSLLPGPQDIGQGLGEGISSFLQTLPQIGQSFQSLLPSFDNFQFPSFPSQVGSQSISSNVPTVPVTQPSYPTAGMVTPVGPDPVTEPTDPDDIIYNDNIKPVHEDHDPVTDPYSTNKLPPGQYLVASHPVFGTHTQDLSEFDYINPFKIHKKIKEEVVDFFSDLFAFRR